MKKTLIHPRLGEITLQRTRRARRISVSVRPPGSVRLTIPARVSERDGMAFLDEKEAWIVATLERVRQTHPVKIIEPPYRTAGRELLFRHSEDGKISARIAADRITLSFPQDMEHSSPAVQQAARDAIIRALRSEAKQTLPQMVAELAAKHGFRYRSVTVRATRTRWGSCSGRDDISLSLYLMTLPVHLVEYIILHELCHTRHKDHSPRFHALLDSLLGGREKELIRELRNHRTDIL